MKSPARHWRSIGWIWNAGWWLCLHPGATLLAQPTDLEITGIGLTATEVRVAFRDLGNSALAYRLEHAASLTPPFAWQENSEANIADLGAGAFQATIVRPSGDLGFFRVVAQLNDGEEVTSAVFRPGTLAIREGDNQGPILLFSRPFTGRIRFTYSGPGIDQSGEIAIGGVREVSLPAPRIPDDEVTDGLRYLTLRLERLSGSEVQFDHPMTVLAEDNDATWLGVLGDGAEVSFIIQTFYSSVGPRVVMRGDATGVFPAGDSVGTDFEFDADRFHVRFPDISWIDPAPPFGGAVAIELILDAQALQEGTSLRGDEISGRYSWRTTAASRPHLTTMTTGGFVLRKQPPAPPANKVPLTLVEP